MNRKVCVVTGSRAEYGIMYWLIKAIHEDPALDLQLVVTNMHLSEVHGSTWREIEKDGFTIDKRVPMPTENDTDVAVAQSAGVALSGMATTFEELRPDLLVVLGDRYEILATASAALLMRIPIAHIAGGETTEGAFDESIRHALTKMSHLHFTATDEYRNRVLQLGENPDHVFNVGALALDNIMKMALLPKAEFEQAIDFELKGRNLLITFHPVTLEKHSPRHQFQALLDAVDQLEDTGLIFTMPNSDPSSAVIMEMINAYVADNGHKAIAFVSMGQLRYLSALRHIDAVVGNSSSGIVEAPSFQIGTINIGDRQKGRMRSPSIIDCSPTEAAISTAFEQLYSPEFQQQLAQVESPYGEGKATEKIMAVIRDYPLDELLKKHFYNLNP